MAKGRRLRRPFLFLRKGGTDRSVPGLTVATSRWIRIAAALRGPRVHTGRHAPKPSAKNNASAIGETGGNRWLFESGGSGGQEPHLAAELALPLLEGAASRILPRRLRTRAQPAAERRRGADLGAAAVSRAVGGDLGRCRLIGLGCAGVTKKFASSRTFRSVATTARAPR